MDYRTLKLQTDTYMILEKKPSSRYYDSVKSDMQMGDQFFKI